MNLTINKSSKQSFNGILPLSLTEFRHNVKALKLENDIFQRSVNQLCKEAPAHNCELDFVILDGVRKEFVEKIKSSVDLFPRKLQNILKDNGYKVYISPNCKKAYKAENVVDKVVENAEKANPLGTLGVTYREQNGSKNFFVFCDKPPYCDLYTKNIVFHEFSHGIVNSLGLNNNSLVKNAINNDIKSFMNKQTFGELTPNERKLINHLLFKSNKIPLNEILAESVAWGNGCGVYGCGLVYGVKNPKLINTLFPNLSKQLVDFLPF